MHTLSVNKVQKCKFWNGTAPVTAHTHSIILFKTIVKSSK